MGKDCSSFARYIYLYLVTFCLEEEFGFVYGYLILRQHPIVSVDIGSPQLSVGHCFPANGIIACDHVIMPDLDKPYISTTVCNTNRQ